MSRLARHGLSESLESYTKRAAPKTINAEHARLDWILEGRRLLGVRQSNLIGMRFAACRVSPGLAVPVKIAGRLLTPSDVIDVENPHAVSGFGDATPPTCDKCGAAMPPAYEECPS